MAFGRSKNRRRQDTAQRNEAVKSVVRSQGPGVVKVVALTLVTGLLVWGGVELRRWALVSPRFELAAVSFTGLQRASRVELLRLAALTKGQNLWALDVGGLERAMLQHPWVKKVDVTRRFPNRVSVEVSEHVPEALAVMGELYVLDEEGEPFKRVTPGDGLDLPLVTGVDREGYVTDPAVARQRFQAALEVARAYAKESPGKPERLSEVRMEGREVTLVAASGQEVRLGEGNSEVKLQRLGRVRRELGARGLAAEIIHLDNRARPGWVAVKLSSPVSERNGSARQ
ncbi:FtsQ-type POTRA domain-containing protein [Myxococcus sp. CA051A]|nr:MULTISPECIES: FtsQ-type POTRA domain-containing protein [Myxococcus]NTX00779.1 FtsQ-type POTRA domain-containing protein [Myxococcus sp. CA040A]NTX12517.1 FtsQ-type POTRA domain-containing protein [Myxococcus sp. CA056]NTX33536.1 FtsQ-type POTRA domain-containing protein [Myxococcus sp. CA033]NTX57102.1 FtsQ-type POTRA domain-containing protein [Myxococcus sp. CA039A]NTX59357.1 FtsQ-type POTRA domain-containing protein [Myxococcus sp. CA051A]